MNKIIFGDCRVTMRDLIAQGVKVQTCVTSPPYFGLRQYIFDGACQIRYDLPHEQKQKIEEELQRRGIRPRTL